MIGATVCAASSTITLNTPASDSVVTSPTIELSGNVTQASQVEVEIDGSFDSSIQLSLGQTTYSGSVQVSPGTHTIKVTAISVCPSTNGTASSVVTFAVPPQTPSTGTSTSTNVGGGVTVDSMATVNHAGTDNNGGLLQQVVVVPLHMIGMWLNINQNDYAHADTMDKMGIVRAVTFGVGLYLAIIGFTASFLTPIVALPILAAIVPGATLPLRVRWLGRASRILGILLVLGTLFL